jgi:hypothetical protein
MHDGKLYKTVCPQEDKLTGVVRDSGAAGRCMNMQELCKSGFDEVNVVWLRKTK